MTDALLDRAESKIAFIILFGSFARGDWVSDSYRKDGILYEYASDYDLLVLTRQLKHGRGKPRDRLQAEFSNLLNRFRKPYYSHSPTVIVEALPFVNKRLAEGQYFFSDIMKDGIVLYQTDGFDLAKPRKLGKAQLRRIAQDYYDQWFPKGKSFLRLGKSALDENDHNISAFLLHQATEHLLNCALLVLSNYKPKTHDLESLLKLCCSQSNNFLNIFNRADGWQKICFEKLRSAYIEARYEKSFTITTDQLIYLIARVEVLQDATRKVCQDWIARLDDT